VNHAVDHDKRHREQMCAHAWAGEAEAVLDAEQRAMCRALDQGAVRVEKPVFLPVQRSAEMRADIAVQVELVVLAHEEKKFVARFDFLRAAFEHFVRGDQCRHQSLLM